MMRGEFKLVQNQNDSSSSFSRGGIGELDSPEMTMVQSSTYHTAQNYTQNELKFRMMFLYFHFARRSICSILGIKIFLKIG